MPVDIGARRLTSDRNVAINDTGRTAFCGPIVIAGITGYPVSKVEAEIVRFRCGAPDQKTLIKGTYTEDVVAALAHYGWSMTRVANYLERPRKERPSIFTWMQQPRNAWSHYILAVHKKNEGHWVLLKGVKLLDTYSEGKWEFVCDGPHKGAKVMEVFEVKRALV
jgi:hypothetical protein